MALQEREIFWLRKETMNLFCFSFLKGEMTILAFKNETDGPPYAE